MTRVAGSLIVIATVLWVLVLPQPDDSSPADASRRRPRPDRDRPTRLRDDPLDPASRAEGEAALRRLREILGRPSSCVGFTSWFRNQMRSGWTALRLFTLGYPELAERWAQQAAEDSSTPRFEKGVAFSVLGWLAEAHWGAARSVLLRHTEESIDHLGPYLLEPQGDLPEDKARKDLEEARTTLLDERPCTTNLTWAIRLARQRRAPWLEATLRHRLDAEYESGRVELAGELVGDGLYRGGPEVVIRVDSLAFDDVLLALLEIGSPLTGRERAYLLYYGYLGDPRARLAELLWNRD